MIRNDVLATYLMTPDEGVAPVVALFRDPAPEFAAVPDYLTGTKPEIVVLPCDGLPFRPVPDAVYANA